MQGYRSHFGPTPLQRPLLIAAVEEVAGIRTEYLWTLPARRFLGKLCERSRAHRCPIRDVIFEFHPGRGKEYAQALLGDFKGYLQRDGYGVYGALARERPSLVPCGCMAHVRRKLVEALDHQPTETHWLMVQIRKLYLIEAHAEWQ